MGAGFGGRAGKAGGFGGGAAERHLPPCNLLHLSLLYMYMPVKKLSKQKIISKLSLCMSLSSKLIISILSLAPAAYLPHSSSHTSQPPASLLWSCAWPNLAYAALYYSSLMSLAFKNNKLICSLIWRKEERRETWWYSVMSIIRSM